MGLHINPRILTGLRLDGSDYPLQSLRVLRLDHNNIDRLDEDVFQHIEMNIEELYIGNNPLKVLNTTAVIAITGIQELKIPDLSYTQLTNLPEHFLHTPRDLIKLDLSGNRMELIPETLIDAQSLQELIIDNNPIRELTEKNGFPAVKSLKVLHMCNMPNLTHIGPSSLAGLENLEELYVTNNNKLSRIDHHTLVRLNVETYVWPTIKILDLSNNQLTHLNDTFLGRWQSLKSLHLRNNPRTCECENQRMPDEMMRIYLDLHPKEAEELRCGAPLALDALYQREGVMCCLDIYRNHLEIDGTMLIGVLIGVLLEIFYVLLVIYVF